MADEGGGGGVLRQLLALFSFDVDPSSHKKVDSALEKLGEKVKHFGEALAAAFAVEAVHRFIEGQVQAMRAIEHTAARLGISTEKVQEFTFAAESLGLEAETLTNLMGRLQVSAAAAATGTGMQAKAFAQLGVKVKDSNGHIKDADELMLDVADGISKQTDASKQAALATELFGRQGRVLLPFLKEGRKGIEEITKDFKELGAGYDELSLKKGKEFEKQQARLSLVMKGVKNQIVGALLPPITWLVGKITLAVNAFRKWAEGTELVRVTLAVLAATAIALALPIIAAWLPVIAPFLLWAAALAAVILILDDIVNFLEGNDSVLGRAIDRIFGKGMSTHVLFAIKEIWKDLADAIREAARWATEFANLSITDKLLGFTGLNRVGAGIKGLATGGAEAGLSGLITGEAPALASGNTPKGGGIQGPDKIIHVVSQPTINVQAAPGNDPKKTGEIVGGAHDEHMQRTIKDAAATFQRAQ